jgi:hypothetical protein
VDECSARRVSHDRYEIGPEFWEVAEESVGPQRSDRSGELKGVGGSLEGRTQSMTALESLQTTDYWDGHPDGLAQWEKFLKVTVEDG